MTERVSITVTPPGVPDSKVFRRWAEVQATRQHYDELQWHWEKDADGKPMARLTGVMHEFTGTPMGAKAAWIEDPPSEEICHQLNAAGASLCMHNRNPCYLRCGVALFGDMLGSQWSETWRVIDPVDRANWKADLFNG